jgi:hypothetical protein
MRSFPPVASRRLQSCPGLGEANLHRDRRDRRRHAYAHSAAGIIATVIESQTYAWILLSVPAGLGTAEEIAALADGINHGIPSSEKLQTSLDWLRVKGLVRQEGSRYCTTEAGVRLLARCRARGGTMMKTWDLVAEALEPLRAASSR